MTRRTILPPMTPGCAAWAARYCRVGNVGALTQLFNPLPDDEIDLAAEKRRDARLADQMEADAGRRAFVHQLQNNGWI